MWRNNTSPGQGHCHVQGEIVLKGTCSCSFSALVDTAKIFHWKIEWISKMLPLLPVWVLHMGIQVELAPSLCHQELFLRVTKIMPGNEIGAQDILIWGWFIAYFYFYYFIYVWWSSTSSTNWIYPPAQNPRNLCGHWMWARVVWYIFTDHCNLFPTWPVAQIPLILGDSCLLTAIGSLETPNIPQIFWINQTKTDNGRFDALYWAMRLMRCKKEELSPGKQMVSVKGHKCKFKYSF